MRRMRGEIGRFFFLALAARDCGVLVLLADDFAPVVAFGFAELDFGAFDLGDPEVCGVDVGAAEGAEGV
jgi:hypothetical protein